MLSGRQLLLVSLSAFDAFSDIDQQPKLAWSNAVPATSEPAPCSFAAEMFCS
jgi:hypothetical protein